MAVGKLLASPRTPFRATVTDDHHFTILPQITKPADFEVSGYFVVDNVLGETVHVASTFSQAALWVEQQ